MKLSIVGWMAVVLLGAVTVLAVFMSFVFFTEYIEILEDVQLVEYLVFLLTVLTTAFTFVIAVLAVNTFGALTEVRRARSEGEEMISHVGEQLRESQLLLSMMPEIFTDLLHASHDAGQGVPEAQRRAHMIYTHLSNWFELVRLEPNDPQRLHYCREIIGAMSTDDNKRILLEALNALETLSKENPDLTKNASPLLSEGYKTLGKMENNQLH